MRLAEFLTQSPDGEIRLTGHRIGLYHVIRGYNEGESGEMLAARYPTLPLAIVYKVLAFYLENQAEVDAYMVACSTAMDEQQRSARPLDLSALRRRLSRVQLSASEAQVH
jgi:uncharacterized protein (DUF433 family)